MEYNEYDRLTIFHLHKEAPMADYRLQHLDLSTRIHLAMQMLDPSRPWGLVTVLAKDYQVSRKFLYQQRDRARASLLSALAASVAVPASIRGIQT